MLYFFSGTDTEKMHGAVDALIKKEGKGARIVRVSDISTLTDVQFACSGGGMFMEKRIVILSGIFGSEREDLQQYILAVLPVITKMQDIFVITESDIKADGRKVLEKHAAKSEKFEAAGKKAKEYPTVFALVDALRSKDKKALWVGYQKELLKGSAPEMILGTLFWGVKKMFTEARDPAARTRARDLMVLFTELPHDCRRRGEDLEYALERTLLAIA